MALFSYLKEKLQRMYQTITSPFAKLFSRRYVDEEVLKEAQHILLDADAGVMVTQNIIENVREGMQRGDIVDGANLKAFLKTDLMRRLNQYHYQDKDACVILLVGINGSGKTTSAAKLANVYLKEGKRVLLVAADTFRAAAVQQLQKWAVELNVDIVVGKEGSDPASVVYGACERVRKESFDVVIVDTAGRLQIKANLMRELTKIRQTITKVLPHAKISTLLTLDTMLGQNSFEQARLFNESTPIGGIILTKMDGTGKGGIVFSISGELKLPIAYVSYGESLDDIALFDACAFCDALLG